jgi:hypothetical protein
MREYKILSVQAYMKTEVEELHVGVGLIPNGFPLRRQAL